MKKWNELTEEQRALALKVMREVGAKLRVAVSGESRSMRIDSFLMSAEARNAGEALAAAAEELENPTWDDEPAPAPGEIVR